jgi:hypothetical protein
MKSPVLGLALSAVAFGASTVYLWVQLAAVQKQAEISDQANAALSARVMELQRNRRQEVQQMAGNFGTAAHDSRVDRARPVQPGEAPPPPPDDNDRRVWSRTVVNAPEMPEAMRRMMRANLRTQNKRMYFDLQTKLGLTDDQTSDLLDLLTDQQTIGLKGQRNLDPEQARESWEAEQAKRKTAINDLLGAAKAAQFEDYQKAIPARSELMLLSQQLEGVDTPLTDEQRSRLLDVMVDERERIPAPAYADGTYDEWQADYEKRVADQARGILTSEQLNTFHEYQQWQQQMREQMAQRGAGGPTRMRGNAMFMPGPAGGVAFAVSTDAVSSSPTEKQPDSK